MNFENFGDVRQTRFESTYTGRVTNPVFKDIHTPFDGFCNEWRNYNKAINETLFLIYQTFTQFWTSGNVG